MYRGRQFCKVRVNVLGTSTVSSDRYSRFLKDLVPALMQKGLQSSCEAEQLAHTVGHVKNMIQANFSVINISSRVLSRLPGQQDHQI
ncbi:unnamed protein product [Larinioides sclopetarius]|uniref:Uncharacterized protein n=1 Tax=Larinioides sclopetarius TaxID=280406 RepID=A0AAV1Z495_9ARAC